VHLSLDRLLDNLVDLLAEAVRVALVSLSPGLLKGLDLLVDGTQPLVTDGSEDLLPLSLDRLPENVDLLFAALLAFFANAWETILKL